MELINKFYKDVRLIKSLIFFQRFYSGLEQTVIARSPSVPLFATLLGFQVSSFHAKKTWFLFLFLAVSQQERLSTPGTGNSYARTDNVTWSHLAFPIKDETPLNIAKFKTRIFR